MILSQLHWHSLPRYWRGTLLHYTFIGLLSQRIKGSTQNPKLQTPNSEHSFNVSYLTFGAKIIQVYDAEN